MLTSTLRIWFDCQLGIHLLPRWLSVTDASLSQQPPRIDPDIEPSLRSRFTKRSKTLTFQSSRPDRSVVLSVPRYGKSAKQKRLSLRGLLVVSTFRDLHLSAYPNVVNDVWVATVPRIGLESS